MSKNQPELGQAIRHSTNLNYTTGPNADVYRHEWIVIKNLCLSFVKEIIIAFSLGSFELRLLAGGSDSK